MKKEKPFLTIDQQIDKLKEQGLIISDITSAKRILKTHSYYTYVNGYCDLLVKSKSPRIFKTGATFEELQAIRDFDTSFRRFLFPQILYIEEKIKASCISGFCGEKNGKKLANTFDNYLLLSSYDAINFVKASAASNLIFDFCKAIKSNLNKKNPLFVHSDKNYGYIPFWVLATNLSFGQISKFYECLHYEVRVKIAKVYRLEERELRTILKALNYIRNCCAHNNRVYLVDIPVNLPKKVGVGKYETWVDPKSRHKFGTVLYAARFLLSTNKFEKMINELSKELTRLKSRLVTIRIQDVLSKMGISSKMITEFGISLEPKI